MMRTLLLLIATLVCQYGFAQKSLITDAKKEEIQQYIKHFEDHNRLMGTVSIFENGQEVVGETFGPQNVAAPSLENRKYTIGSITKTYTAVLAAKLKEENRLSFDEHLSDYFPSIAGADKITLRQMLNHTSGLRNYVVKNDSLPFWLKEPRTHTEILDQIRQQGLAFEPGDSMQYSNSAYYLLGKIVEKKHQKKYSQVVQDEIAKPLQLQNTIVLDEAELPDNVAKSYERKGGQWQVMEEFYFPNAFAAGNIATSAKDVVLFLNKLFAYKLISQSTLTEMLPQGNDWFGLGIMKAPFYEHKGYGHGGDTYGTHSVASYDPESGISLAYIINGEDYPTNDFAVGLLSIIYDKDYKLPDFTAYIPNKNFYEAYEGVYETDKLPITIKIYKEGDELMAQGEGQDAFALTPKAKQTFEYLKAGVVIEFNPYENKLVLKQGGQTFEMVKK